jgi:hypothetical protein
MPPDPEFRPELLRVTVATALIAWMLAFLVFPDASSAALRAAAGGGQPGGGGFVRFVNFVDRLADYTIPIGSAFSVLGLIWGGLLFQAGDQRAGRVLGFVALGLGIVLLSKPIAA